jgi:membrane dipeptidase
MPVTETETPGARSTEQVGERECPFIIDAHIDLAWNWLDLGRHPGESALASRPRESGTAVPTVMGVRTTGLSQWLSARVGIIFATVFVMPATRAESDLFGQTYRTVQEADDRARHQVDAYRRLVDEEPQFALVTGQQELESVVTAWKDRTSDPRVGIVLLMEGADPIREPAEVHDWYERGLRLIGPAWAATRYSGSCNEPGPLSPLGKHLLDEMADLNMVLDLSHMADEAAFQALDSYPGPVIASHSNPKRIANVARNLSDDLIRNLAARQGVIGVVPFNGFLKTGWRRGDRRDDISLHRVADAVDHIAQVTGSCDHVGLGTDLDGGFGAESLPVEMDSAADLPLICRLLRERGYSPTDLDSIHHGNWLRVLRNCLP